MAEKSTQSPISAVAQTKTGTLQAANPADLVSAGVKRMHEEKIGALAVVENGRLVGMFTERDALYRVINARRDPNLTTLSEVMTPDPEPVSPDLKVIDAMRLVTEQHFRHLPLVDKDKLVGMVSSGDLTRWFDEARDAEIAKLDRSLSGLASKNKALIALVLGFAILIVVGILTS